MDDKETQVSITERLKRNNPQGQSQEEVKPEAVGVAKVGVEGEVVPAPVELKPKAGEVLFEVQHEGTIVRTALPTGVEVELPYVTSKAKEIEWLTEFAEHTQMVAITKGQ